MVYLSYEAAKKRYLETQKRFEDILSEKERLFSRTQPKATTFDKERVNGGEIRNTFEDYIIEKEKTQIDNRLEESKVIMHDCEWLLKLKEQELRHSKHIHDRIYCLKYLDRIRVYKIARRLNYSERQVYRILREIDSNLKHVTKSQGTHAKILE